MTSPICSFHQSRTPPRCSAPRRSLCLVSGSATAATVPRQPRFVPLCGHRSTNASSRCRPLRLLASLRWLHIVFIPSAAQGLLLPFAASVATRAFSPTQTMLPQHHRGCPTLRGLTTTFRSTVCRHRDCADTRHRFSSSSGRPAAPASPSPEGYTKRRAHCAVVGRAVSHTQNAYCAHLRGQYQQPHPVR